MVKQVECGQRCWVLLSLILFIIILFLFFLSWFWSNSMISEDFITLHLELIHIGLVYIFYFYGFMFYTPFYQATTTGSIKSCKRIIKNYSIPLWSWRWFLYVNRYRKYLNFLHKDDLVFLFLIWWVECLTACLEIIC